MAGFDSYAGRVGLGVRVGMVVSTITITFEVATGSGGVGVSTGE